MRKVLLGLLFALLACAWGHAQSPLYSAVLVSNTGTGNGIGNANTSRNVAVDAAGNIYIVSTGSAGIRVAKSTNRGQSFSASVQVTSTNAECEIEVADNGTVYVVWSNGTVFFSRSTDGGATFSAPLTLGGGSQSRVACYQSNVYVISTSNVVYRNATYGAGAFASASANLTSIVYVDIRVNQQTGVVYAVSDNPTVYMSKSTNNGATFTPFALSGGAYAYYSSYALSGGPLGDFMFVSGSDPTGYKINVATGVATALVMHTNTNSVGRTLVADPYGNFVDGYTNGATVGFRISYNQGITWQPDVTVATASTHNIFRNQVYQDIVVAYAASGQVYCTVYGNILPGGISTGTITGSPFCAGSGVSVPYTATGTFNAGNVFTAQLSDTSGSFASPVNIGSVTATTSGIISGTIPVNSLAGSGYRIRVVSSTPVVVGSNNGADIAVNPIVTPSVSINSSATNACGATAITYTATITNGGASPLVQWFANGSNTGQTGLSYVRNFPDNGDAVYAVLTSNAPCASPLTATSGTITLSGLPTSGQPTIAADGPLWYCAPYYNVLRLTPNYCRAGRTYRWMRNSGLMPAQYNQDTIRTTPGSASYRLLVTYNGVTDTSNYIYVNQVIRTFYTGPSNHICNGDSLYLYVDSLPGATFQWRKNNVIIPGATNSFYYAKTQGKHNCWVTLPGGCTNKSAVQWVYVNNCSAKTDEWVEMAGELATELLLSPNPNTGHFQLLLDGVETETAEMQLEVYNLSGQLMAVRSIQLYMGESTPVDDLNLPAGMYLLRLHNATQSFTKRMQVLR